jgi:hypothetical protein
MKRFSYFALLTLILLTACSSIPGLGATATPSPEPTLTFTPAPTETPTPVPTATRDVIATIEAQKTQAAGDVLTELDKLKLDTDIEYRNGELIWLGDEAEGVELSGPDGRYTPIDEKLTSSNFILKSDVTWQATGIIVCGVIFRSEPDLREGKQYQFLFLRYSGLPAWAVEFHDFGYFKNSPTSVKYSSAVNQKNGSTNQVVLVAQDEKFTIYINGVRQGRFFDNSKQRMDGNFAFLGYQDSGEGSCKFENSWIWELK